MSSWKMTQMKKTNYKNYQKFAENLSLEAGNILLKHEKKIEHLLVHYKEAQGVASSADLASEKHIIKKIKKAFPDHNILAEEDSFHQSITNYKKFCESPYTWIIDPLDGTNNFLNGINYYAICIALAHYGKPVVGVVYRPSTGEGFTAIEGHGAFFSLNGFKTRKKMLLLTNKKELKQSIFCTGFASEKGERISEEFLPFKRILTNSRAVRRMGSAALDLCYVARGIYDGFWERQLAPWDVAAAGLICLEAGSKVTDFSGQAFTPFDRTIVAARTPLYHKIKNLIALNKAK